MSSLPNSDFNDSLKCPGIKLFSIINGTSQLKIVKSIIIHSVKAVWMVSVNEIL